MVSERSADWKKGLSYDIDHGHRNSGMPVCAHRVTSISKKLTAAADIDFRLSFLWEDLPLSTTGRLFRVQDCDLVRTLDRSFERHSHQRSHAWFEPRCLCRSWKREERKVDVLFSGQTRFGKGYYCYCGRHELHQRLSLPDVLRS